MAKNRLEISRIGERQLRKLPRDAQRRVVKGILALADEPLAKGARRLTGYDDVFRIRIGRYRVLYSVTGRRLVIVFLKVGQRKDVYRPGW